MGEQTGRMGEQSAGLHGRAVSKANDQATLTTSLMLSSTGPWDFD
jgi:hypothetical protein